MTATAKVAEGTLVRYYDNGMRFAYFEQLDGDVAVLRPPPPIKATLRIPIADVETSGWWNEK